MVEYQNNEVNFDEIITFNHTYLKFRLFDGFKPKLEEFPFLMNHEFLLADGDLTFKSIFLENIGFYAKEIGFENTIDLLLPLMSKLVDEKDILQIKFLNNIKEFLDFLNENGEEGYKLIRDQIVPVISEMFGDKNNPKLIEKCSDALVEITKYIRDEDRGYHILTIVIIMAHDDSDEESRVLAAKLFNSLAPIIGRELCELYVVPQIASFADDPNSKVRKAVATNFMNMCTSISENAFKAKLLPVYTKLSKDSLWIVRKAAAEILPKITSFCDSQTVSSVLLEIFKNFTNDSQKYVRIAAVEVLGKFIILLKKEDLNSSILDFYTNIINEYYSNKDSSATETDIIYNCAYNFPAVLITFGCEYWKDLRKVYFKMANDKDFRVKKSIASSIGEIAKIIGKESTQEDLLGIVEKLYKEEGEIRNIIMKNAPLILKNLDPNYKLTYLEKLRRFLNIREKWRTRFEYAKIIASFNYVYDDDITYKQVFPISLNFCTDDVAEVRFKSAKNCSKIVYQLLSGEISSFRETTHKIILSFATSINYHFRQQFSLLVNCCFQSEEMIEKLFIRHLYALSNDKVVNVRITLAKVISREIFKKKNTWILKNKNMITIIKKLINDKSKNVLSYFSKLTDEERKQINEASSVEIKTYDIIFDNKMNILKETFGISRNLPLNSLIKKENFNHPKINNISSIINELNKNNDSGDSNIKSNSDNDDEWSYKSSNNNKSIDDKKEDDEYDSLGANKNEDISDENIADNKENSTEISNDNNNEEDILLKSKNDKNNVHPETEQISN